MSDIMTPPKIMRPSATMFSERIAKAKAEGKIPATPTKDVITAVAMKQAEVYEPLLTTKEMTDEEKVALVESIRWGGMRAVDEAIQRGRFTFSDIEKITAAMTALTLHPGADANTYKTNAAVGANLDRLIRLIQARETVELNQETVDRIRTIEDALMELTT